jgi:hypothetical protein
MSRPTGKDGSSSYPNQDPQTLQEMKESDTDRIVEESPNRRYAKVGFG